MKKEIIRKLHELTPVEERQRKTGLFIEDMPAGALNMQEGHGRTLNNYFFRNREIYLSRHNRFAPYPLHRHTFLEINYMLRGSADQTVDGNLVHLDQGDLILLDVGTSHSISALGENDLLINILFRNTNISLDLLKELKGQGSVLFNFLLKEEDERKATRDFVVFRTDNNALKDGQIGNRIIAITLSEIGNHGISPVLTATFITILDDDPESLPV